MRSVCITLLPLGDEPPEWIPLLPNGPIDARDGRHWLNDAPDAVVAQTRTRAGAADLVIDYEHQTDKAPSNGAPAPAAGWVKEVAVRDGVVSARVEWTARAAQHIVAGEYRYVSPVFWHDADPPHRIHAVERVALTNSPAITALPALASTQEGAMPEHLKRFLERFNLKLESSQAEVGEAVSRLDARAGVPARTALAAALGLASDANEESILAQATTLHAAAQNSGATPDPALYVPIAQHTAVTQELSTLKGARAEEKALAAVDAAVAGGKVIPAIRGWALDYARRDLAGFEAYIATAPAIVEPGARTTPTPPDPDAALTTEERAVCRAMGITEDKFIAGRKLRLAAASGEAS